MTLHDTFPPQQPTPVLRRQVTLRDRILVVLGMHRSGTSFLTDCTEVLGFTLPGDRNGPAPDNPKGHFEPRAIVDLNESALARAGASWARIAPLDAGPNPDEMEAALQASFGKAARIVIKDPRMSLLMPAWRPFLETLGQVSAVISLRNPAEVAASVARRDAISADHSYLSWISHILTALDSTEGLPRMLVLFPDWTGRPAETLNRMAQIASVDLPDDAAGAILARFQRSAVHGGRQTVATVPAIDRLANDLFDLLADHARAGTVPASRELAPYRRQFDIVSSSARATEAHLGAEIFGLQADVAQLRTDNGSLQTQVAEAVAERHHVVASLEAQRDQADEDLKQQALELDKLQAQLNGANQQLARATEQLNHLTQLLQIERNTVLKPIYRRLHRRGGRVLRNCLPQSAFDWLKHAMPHPGQIPGYLAYASPKQPSGEARNLIDVPPADPDKPDIFIMSIINWDFRTQRPQHLASELARTGHRVFYIEMEGDSGGGSAREVGPNLHVLRLPARGMRGAQPYSGTVPPTAIRAWIDHFHALVDQIGTTRRAHVIVEHPYWWNFVRHLSSQYQITFDCMDEIAGFSNTDRAVLELEEQMIDAADRVVVSSQYLHDKYAARRPVKLIRNGTDTGHFICDDTDEPSLPGFLSGKLRDGAIRVGYVGAIAEWFDADLVEAMAAANPDFDIHLCGAVTAEAPARLADLPNVTMHGEIAYADVPGFLAAMDVMTIPFRLLPIIRACDPVKFYEYSAMKRPTVATALPELRRAGKLVTLAAGATEFAEGIRAAAEAGKDPATRAALQAYALENTWSDRAAHLLAEMERAPKVSVVVLAYGQADLTLDCLDSLLGQGEVYPALDVLVVDNGSAPEALARLRDRAGTDPRIRLIENGDNLGFAGGNNIGIGAADGDYVLLLNNDTYMPPGAIAAMVRHLERNPQIGIVGPLTNNIGNEARIEVSYSDMAGMETVARDLVTGYRGIWTEIPVAAYFCAMFRKSDLDRIGDLPIVYGRGMFEDDDHCASFRAAGLISVLAEDAFVHHRLSASFDALPAQERQDLFSRNRKIFEDRWGAWVPHRYRQTRPAPSLPNAS